MRTKETKRSQRSGGPAGSCYEGQSEPRAVPESILYDRGRVFSFAFDRENLFECLEGRTYETREAAVAAGKAYSAPFRVVEIEYKIAGDIEAPPVAVEVKTTC